MKAYSRTIAILATLMIGLAVSPAGAQDNGLTANVPLEFKIGGTDLPRGAYSISHLEGQPDVLLVRSERQGVIVRAERLGVNRASGSAQLIFRRSGDSYFLREIRFSSGLSLNLPETREEREAVDQRSGVETFVVFAERR
jgi:hypothetical protein